MSELNRTSLSIFKQNLPVENCLISVENSVENLWKVLNIGGKLS